MTSKDAIYTFCQCMLYNNVYTTWMLCQIIGCHVIYPMLYTICFTPYLFLLYSRVPRLLNTSNSWTFENDTYHLPRCQMLNGFAWGLACGETWKMQLLTPSGRGFVLQAFKFELEMTPAPAPRRGERLRFRLKWGLNHILV